MAAVQPVDARGVRSRRALTVAGRTVPSSLLVIVGFIVLWEVGAAVLSGTGDRLAPLKLPFPHVVARAILVNGGLLLNAAWQTAAGALIGLFVGTATGAVIGILMAQARWLEDATYPYLVGAQMIPTIALAPIVFGAVHDPMITKVIVAAYISVFPISLGTIKGLKSAPPDGLALMRTYSATRFGTMRYVRIPAALPYFFAGLRVAAPLAVVGEIVVELAGSKDGLGTLMVTTQYYGVAQAGVFWASLVVTLVLGFVFAKAAAGIERVVAPWQPAYRS
jgi:NitT/TauT family transport system permease protein